MKGAYGIRVMGPVVVLLPRGFAVTESRGAHDTIVELVLDAPIASAGTPEEGPREHLGNALFVLLYELDRIRDVLPDLAASLQAATNRVRVAYDQLPEG